MKIVFMGTPDYSVPTLQALIDSKHEIVGVYTKPDKPKGRGKKMDITPVKALALEANIPVFQPVSFKMPETVETLKELKADLAVVIAYGLILPQSVLDAFAYGCINLHASLLPKYRGASPIQSVLLAGENKTGVTAMQMDKGLDTGNMLKKVEVDLDGTETAGQLHDSLAKLSAKLCIETLIDLEAGKLTPELQAEAEASYAGKISKQMGKIDWKKSAKEIERQIRAMNPWPSAYTYWNGKVIKIWKATSDEAEIGTKFQAGEIYQIRTDSIQVACGKGVLTIFEVQLEGKKRIQVSDFLNGYGLKKGEAFTIQRN